MTEAGVDNLHACFPHLLKANIRANLVANNNDVERNGRGFVEPESVFQLTTPAGTRVRIVNVCMVYRVMLGIGI